MKRKVCPKKALAVILAASLALSPTITVSAASLGDGEVTLDGVSSGDAGDGEEAGKSDETVKDSSEEAPTDDAAADKKDEETTEKPSDEAEDVAERTVSAYEYGGILR